MFVVFPAVLVAGFLVWVWGVCLFSSVPVVVSPYLFISGCAGSSLLCKDFSLVAMSGGSSSCAAWASHWSGFSCCEAQTLGHSDFRSCGTQA